MPSAVASATILTKAATNMNEPSHIATVVTDDRLNRIESVGVVGRVVSGKY